MVSQSFPISMTAVLNNTGAGLRVQPEAMLALAHKAAELLVEWNKDFLTKRPGRETSGKCLEDQWMEEPPGNGRDAPELDSGALTA